METAQAKAHTPKAQSNALQKREEGNTRYQRELRIVFRNRLGFRAIFELFSHGALGRIRRYVSPVRCLLICSLPHCCALLFLLLPVHVSPG